MAIWNFECDLIPKGAPPPVETADGLDCSVSWDGAVEPDWFAIVEGSLERRDSWSPDIELWGSQEYIELRVIHEGHAVLEAHMRVDVRVDHTKALTILMRRLERAGLEIVVWPHEPFSPTSQRLWTQLRSSRAYQAFDRDAKD
jgi:hypothetical protein